LKFYHNKDQINKLNKINFKCSLKPGHKRARFRAPQ